MIKGRETDKLDIMSIFEVKRNADLNKNNNKGGMEDNKDIRRR